MKNKWMALICVVGFTALGQTAGYLGPGVPTRGSGDIGVHSGEAVDLRYYFDVSGIYETGLQPFAVDSKGNLAQINGLYGVQADLGVFGTHRWKQASLGLDYKGDFYHYTENSFYDGSSHNLTLGYTYQQSRRIIYDMRAIAGTSSLGYGVPGFYGGVPVTGTSDVVNTSATALFDNRIYYLEPSMDMTFLQTARTSYTVGGDGFFVRRAAVGLASMNGYNLHGSIRHRLSRTKSVAATYEHVHYDFPPAFGQSDMNTANVSFNSSLGREWTFSASVGAFQTEVQGVQQILLNPVVAALLGFSVGHQAFYREDYYPSAQVNLTGRFKTWSATFAAGQTIVPGNGVYLTSRQQSGALNFSYTGVKKWNFGLNGSYNRLASIGQGIQSYDTFNGGAGVIYTLTRAMHIIARADSRYQEITAAGYNRTGYRASFGLGFSPGNVPLSLW